jgi:hypothetical protein
VNDDLRYLRRHGRIASAGLDSCVCLDEWRAANQPSLRALKDAQRLQKLKASQRITAIGQIPLPSLRSIASLFALSVSRARNIRTSHTQFFLDSVRH